MGHSAGRYLLPDGAASTRPLEQAGGGLGALRGHEDAGVGQGTWYVECSYDLLRMNASAIPCICLGNKTGFRDEVWNRLQDTEILVWCRA